MFDRMFIASKILVFLVFFFGVRGGVETNRNLKFFLKLNHADTPA